MITIAFESKRLFQNLTGYGAYSRTLVGDLSEFYAKNRYCLFAHESFEKLSKSATFLSSEIQRTVNLASVNVVYPPTDTSFYWKLFGAKRQLRIGKVDVYHGLTNQLPRSIRGIKVPKILTIHDLIYRHFPKLFPGEDLEGYDRQLRKACSISDKIVAVSQSTKNDLINEFSIKPEKISVIYQACDQRFRARVSTDWKKEISIKYGLPEKYLLSVGSMTERKNLLTVVKAMKQIPVKDRLPLVVIGARTSYTDAVLAYVAKHQLESSLVFPIGVSNDDLPAIYQGAEVFIYTSLYEGFGIPILEALASGTPIIASNVSAMPEAGGSDSRLVDPRNVDETSDAINDMLRDSELRREMVRKGYIYSNKFSNEIVATQMMNLYQEAIGCTKENNRIELL